MIQTLFLVKLICSSSFKVGLWWTSFTIILNGGKASVINHNFKKYKKFYILSTSKQKYKVYRVMKTRMYRAYMKQMIRF